MSFKLNSILRHFYGDNSGETFSGIISDNRILPGGYSIVEYDVPIPQNVNGIVTIEATLRYWPFPQKVVDELLREGNLKVEIVEMCKATQTIEVSQRLAKGLTDK